MSCYEREKQRRQERESEREREIMRSIPMVVRALSGEAMKQSQRLFKCARQIYSHGKLSRDGILSP